MHAGNVELRVARECQSEALAMRYRFRFSIVQVMGLIALSALIMANAIFMGQGNFAFNAVINAAIAVAGLGVLLSNRRLSQWTWVWIAGQSEALLLMIVPVLLGPLYTGSFASGYASAAIILSLGLICSLLTIVGFAMTLRDIRRKLAIYENAPSSEVQGLTAPTDRSDCQILVGEEIP
jgi:hypothetical protein